MVTLSVVYPRSECARFDYDRYRDSHLPLVEEKLGALGLKGAYALRGLGAPDGGDAAFFAMAFLNFESPEALAKAMGSPEAGEVLADIPSFTNVRPTVQVNEHIA